VARYSRKDEALFVGTQEVYFQGMPYTTRSMYGRDVSHNTEKNFSLQVKASRIVVRHKIRPYRYRAVGDHLP
jgi:hypothetical protein